MRLEPDGKNGRIEKIHKIVLNIPEDFEPDGDCTPVTTNYEWSGDDSADNLYGMTSAIIYCPFKLKQGAMSDNVPTKTYLVTAYATYTFTRTKKMTSKVEFGGKCCSDEDCLEGQVCCRQQEKDGLTGGYCIPKGTKCEGTVASEELECDDANKKTDPAERKEECMYLSGKIKNRDNLKYDACCLTEVPGAILCKPNPNIASRNCNWDIWYTD